MTTTNPQDEPIEDGTGMVLLQDMWLVDHDYHPPLHERSDEDDDSADTFGNEEEDEEDSMGETFHTTIPMGNESLERMDDDDEDDVPNHCRRRVSDSDSDSDEEDSYDMPHSLGAAGMLDVSERSFPQGRISSSSSRLSPPPPPSQPLSVDLEEAKKRRRSRFLDEPSGGMDASEVSFSIRDWNENDDNFNGHESFYSLANNDHDDDLDLSRSSRRSIRKGTGSQSRLSMLLDNSEASLDLTDLFFDMEEDRKGKKNDDDDSDSADSVSTDESGNGMIQLQSRKHPKKKAQNDDEDDKDSFLSASDDSEASFLKAEAKEQALRRSFAFTLCSALGMAVMGKMMGAMMGKLANVFSRSSGDDVGANDAAADLAETAMEEAQTELTDRATMMMMMHSSSNSSSTSLGMGGAYMPPVGGADQAYVYYKCKYSRLSCSRSISLCVIY